MTPHPPDVMRLAVGDEADSQGRLTVVPRSPQEVATILSYATEKGLIVEVIGGGTKPGYGRPPPADIILSMRGLAGVSVWEPDDMTLVVEAGASVDSLEADLNGKGQTLVFPERLKGSTIGGTLATGVSSLRRGRMLGTRERVLETVIVTGDGRIVRSGGRVVKNVTGFDLSRLHVGAFGSLGVIVSVCLKLWPVPAARATVMVESPDTARVIARPLAVLEQGGTTRVYLWGTHAEVEALTARLGGNAVPGLDWPSDPVGEFRWSLRVPPGRTAQAVSRLPDDWDYLAIHGAGDVRASSPSLDGAGELRRWVESIDGHLVVVDSPKNTGFDPWGKVPPGSELQRALISRFDPARVINPGRLPGGI